MVHCVTAHTVLPCFVPHPLCYSCPTHWPLPHSHTVPAPPLSPPQMSQSKQLVQSKEKEVTRLLGEEKALESSFLEKVEENKFKDFLVRVFKKKIKRVKKEVKTGGELARPY